SLLEALELAGVKPTYGCRRGICNRCSCTRIQGQTTDMVSGESSDEPGHPVRICINRASSDLELDL
ncbi:2Fe-2S iron-sulfur cluster-binding protein, partial [Litorivivens sp.]